MFILAGHATLINDKFVEVPINTIFDLLINNKKTFIFIRHSMDGKFRSRVYFYKKGILIHETKLWVISNISVLRYITEILATFIFLFSQKLEKAPTYIGGNPLNAFTGVLLKKIGKINKVIFYTCDYTKNRFENKVLNTIYQKMDRINVFHSDQVWNVSSRIYNLRSDMGLEKSKNIFLPNVPSDNFKTYTGREKSPYTFITMGMLSDQIDYIGFFDAIKILSEKQPKIKLKVLGGGEKEDEYKKYVKKIKMDKNIIFYGQVDHKKVFEELSSSGIGFALYNGKWSFNYYGDSMKCREYFAFGIPVITTDTHSTVEEIIEYKAGIVCKNEVNDYVYAVMKIWDKYKLYSHNAQSLANKYQDIHKKLIESI